MYYLKHKLSMIFILRPNPSCISPQVKNSKRLMLCDFIFVLSLFLTQIVSNLETIVSALHC